MDLECSTILVSFWSLQKDEHRYASPRREKKSFIKMRNPSILKYEAQPSGSNPLVLQDDWNPIVNLIVLVLY